MAEEDLEAVPGHLVPALDCLVPVRDGAHADDAGVRPLQLPGEDEGEVPLHLHERAPGPGVPEDGGGVAVPARGLAPAIRVQGIVEPGELARHDRAEGGDLPHLHGPRSRSPAAIAFSAPSETSYSWSSRTGIQRAFTASEAGIGAPSTYSQRISAIA